MSDQDEGGGAGVLLDHAVAGVARAADARHVETSHLWLRYVCLSGRRAWAADQYRLHVADLPRASAAVDPPLWLHGLDLLCALDDLPQWVPGGQPAARITAIGEHDVTVSLPAETAGPPGELRITVRRIDGSILGFEWEDSPPIEGSGPSPAAVVTAQAQYLRDALEAVAGNLPADQPVTVMIYHDRIVLITEQEHDGRQRAAIVAPLNLPPVRPWWWEDAAPQEETSDA